MIKMINPALARRCGLPVMALPLLLAACGGNPPLPIPGLKESFHTEIAANGAKRFTYSLQMQRRDIPAPYTDQGINSGRVSRASTGRGGRRPTGAGPLQFDRAMKEKLMETGFCRDGYFEIERTISSLGGEVRGECREGASRTAGQ
ncbi:hypothetical protein [Microbulbifer litoralis]|uniref:hypothetical protein n=1 Tax=Microbulbifer litoralis TaxID=2933965 RepID=UPI002027B9F6|nr:hypothetical protein [Microbulbifer sp. GX H0434]